MALYGAETYLHKTNIFAFSLEYDIKYGPQSYVRTFHSPQIIPDTWAREVEVFLT
jgi:hypothetical protein